MPWFSLRMTFYDAVDSKPLMRSINLQGENLPAVIQAAGKELLQAWMDSTELPFGDPTSILLVPLELTAWTSSKSCEKPDVGAQLLLHKTKASVAAFLYSGAGSPSPATPTVVNDSSPRSS